MKIRKIFIASKSHNTMFLVKIRENIHTWNHNSNLVAIIKKSRDISLKTHIKEWKFSSRGNSQYRVTRAAIKKTRNLSVDECESGIKKFCISALRIYLWLTEGWSEALQLGEEREVGGKKRVASCPWWYCNSASPSSRTNCSDTRKGQRRV